MKFTKLAKSDKFEYMMLSRLIQDAKYFIDYPDLKHLWARTLDEHIKQMKEQYAKLDPKPEWTSEEEINNLAKQMKESYINHWNEVHPDNKIEAAIQQPNKPKPTTTLPDNLEWAWDPNAADWVAVMKDNKVTTPPLYDPNNQNLINQNTNYMSNIKSASEKSMMDLAQNIIHDVVLIHKAKSMDSRTEWDGTFAILTLNPEKTDVIDIKYVPQSSLPSYIPNDNEYGLVRTRDTGFDETDYQLQPLEMIIRQRKSDSFAKDDKNAIEIGYKKQSSCLAKFLDGPRYSKEIKIEAGLIKDGLVKYAGFDFNKGAKYAITTKGLEVLRKASEVEHNEALNEREKLAYMFGFNTDKVSTLDTTGKVIKQSARKWTICEADGTELGEVEADNELDAKVKFGIEYPEYADSQSICAKEIKAGLEYNGAFEYNDYKIDLFNDIDGGATFVIYAPEGKTVNHESMYRGTASTMDEAITKAYNIIDGSKEIDAKYEEITESHEPYPNPSETPNDHIILENHDGWVNTASFEDDIRKQFMKPHQPIENSDRDLNLLEEQILQLVNDDKKDEVHKLFDQLQFSDKEASVDPKFAKLHELLGQYKKQDLIQLADVDGHLVASGDPQVINNLEHEVKDIGYYCESVSEDTDSDYAETYSLKIFMK